MGIAITMRKEASSMLQSNLVMKGNKYTLNQEVHFSKKSVKILIKRRERA